MNKTYFITGIGTGVGKTVVSAILAQALEADYWKPVQAGFDNGTDSEWVQSVINNDKTTIYPETYKLKLAASPHLAARAEGINISTEKIFSDYSKIVLNNRPLVIEGAGGIMVPLNEHEFVLDLVMKMNCRVILVSKNYLGSINHSLLTAHNCHHKRVRVAGWIFNDEYMHYEEEIVSWSGYPKIVSVPSLKEINKETISTVAEAIKENILNFL